MSKPGLLLLGPPLAMPILIGSLTEWLPTSGVSWQVPQNPETVVRPGRSLMPATPVMVIGVLLNRASPRATAWRDAFTSPYPLMLFQALYRSKICDVNGRPFVFPPSGSLILT